MNVAIKYIPFIYTLIFAVILVSAVPKANIRKLLIYGIIFGAIFDVVLVSIANITGSFRYINYEPYGLIGIHFLAPIRKSISITHLVV